MRKRRGRPSLEPFELDGSIHAQVGHRAAGKRRGDRDVNRQRPIRRGWIVSAHEAGHHAVTRVDLCRLTHLDVLRLRLRDPQFGLEASRVRYAGQVLPGSDALAYFDRHLLQDP